MRKRFLLVVAMLLFFQPCLQCLSITTDKGQYAKGSVMKIKGDCIAGDFLEISAEHKNGEIFSTNALCLSDGTFSLEREIDFLDPSGEWFIKVESSKTEAQTRVIVTQNAESAFYLITFLSPSAGKYKRTSSLTLTVKVSDSGRPVSDANVAAWLFEGKKVWLENKGNGIYAIDFDIPFDAELGEKELLVTAKSTVAGNNFGGENKIPISIESTTIELNIIKPAVSSFEITNKVPFEVSATYFGGGIIPAASELKVSLEYVGRMIDFVHSGGTYSTFFKAGQEDIGNKTFIINAIDKAGNKGSATVNITFSCSALCYVQLYGSYVLAAIVIALALFSLFYARIKLYFDEKFIQSEKKKTLNLIEQLQKEYFEKAIMSASSYRKALAEYKAKLVELEQKEKAILKKKESL